MILLKRGILTICCFLLFGFTLSCTQGNQGLLNQNPETKEVAYVSREVKPDATSEGITNWNEPHYVCVPTAGNQQIGKLWLFLPGTGATPDYYTTLTQEAAKAGLHSVCLRYPNDEAVNTKICPQDTDPDCHEKVRQEIARGVDVSYHVKVDPANSIEGRIKSLLVYLSNRFPEEGWGQYLNSSGAIVWSSIVIAGHSQGAGHAVYIAYEHKVDHVVAFAWVDIRQGSIAPWLTEKTSQTPPEGYYLFFHQGDTHITRYLGALMTVLGLNKYGAPIIVDESMPPYKGSHSLIATIPPPAGEIAHNTHVVDKSLKFDKDGKPVYSPVWRFLISLKAPVVSPLPTANPTGRAVSIGVQGHSYIDVEFYSRKNVVTFVDENRQAWLANLNPVTGDFMSPDGRDTLIDGNLTPLSTSFNGPEFGIDSDSWALFYTKNVMNTPQIWMATVLPTGVNRELLTEDKLPRLSVLASKNTFDDVVRLLYSQGGFSLTEGKLAWLKAAEFNAAETIVDFIDTGARWIDDTLSFTFIRQSGPDRGQVVIYDTETSLATTITDTTDELSYAYGWIAPEYNELLVLVVVNDTRIEIYRNTGGRYWDCISTLSVSDQSLYGIIGSPEPFTTGGKSYISLVIKETQGYAPAEVWVWGIEEGSGRVALKCYDGQGNIIRSDPESYIGQNEVYIYYNLIRQGASGRQIFELYKWNTGIPAS